MPTDIVYSKIKNQDIFKNPFENFSSSIHNKIAFQKLPNTSGGIAVLYAPNGTGKSSFVKTMEITTSSSDIDFLAKYDNKSISPSNNIFHIIKDQISRNVIPGDTSDYLIGANIKREYSLIKNINDKFYQAFSTDFPKLLKDRFGITKKNDLLLKKLGTIDSTAHRYIEDIVNRSSRGKKIEKKEFIQYLKDVSHKKTQPIDLDNGKILFLIKDFNENNFFEKIQAIDLDRLTNHQDIEQIEQNDDAISIARKYPHLRQCIVCDNDNYNANAILKKKESNRNNIYNHLDEQTRKIFDEIIDKIKIDNSDPFQIKTTIQKLISENTVVDFKNMRDSLNEYVQYICFDIINQLLNIFGSSSIFEDFDELQALQATQPTIDEDELLFIKEVISNNIDAEISITRDETNDKNFKLMLRGHDFLGIERDKLQLSSGEQNFISLAFELLFAKHSNKDVVIIDDPISSFDSVYKNKIAFCLIKFLENKNQIILTHNTDLIRLLEVQLKNSFNLFLFNNTDDGQNGFIPINKKERDILINLHSLIALLQTSDFIQDNVRNTKQFLMSIIPFMRGYAHIIPNGDTIYTNLSKLMHGYTSASENISEIYKTLFNYTFDDEFISTSDMLNLDCNSLDIINSNNYPLLSETLKQTLIYYHLRMKVEKTLVDTFNIPISNHPLLLTDIIRKAFPSIPNSSAEAEQKRREFRVFFLSRKTLINEFNHFEGNMNIFQPAIDITPTALRREINAIEQKLQELPTTFYTLEEGN